MNWFRSFGSVHTVRILVRRPGEDRRLGRITGRGKSKLKMSLPRRGMGRHGLDFTGSK